MQVQWTAQILDLAEWLAISGAASSEAVSTEDKKNGSRHVDKFAFEIGAGARPFESSGDRF
jgi:hypothetical protein